MVAIGAVLVAATAAEMVSPIDVGAAAQRATSVAATGPAAKPDETRFTPVVLVPHGDLDEPMMVAVLPDERAIIIERKGGFKVYDPATKTTSLIATIPVNTKYYSASGRVTEAEEGLFGLTIDPNFSQNRWVYLRYADPQVAKWVLARWDLQDVKTPDGQTKLTLIESSKRVLLEHPAQRERCCHTGGGMAWDKDGNLYMTVGNNTGGGMTDERPGMENSDDQRATANTNDLRGKILRIHPEPDGTYTVPKGNLFPPGTPRARPEIFAMGMRNPWRVSVDSRTGYVYWGEVGPSDQRATGGPTPHDEFNQARGPGFFGFPYFIGDNEGIQFRDYVRNQLLPPRDPNRPVNDSVNNTGLRELPPALPAFIAYSYEVSERHPELGSGAKSAVGGPIYHRADFKADAKRPFPSYYEGKWLAAEFERGWIMAISMDDDSRYVSMEQFLPSYRPLQPIDITFGPEGDLYVLDYGSVWFGKSPDSSLVRIEYNAGNRAPRAVAAASAVGGPVPLQVDLSAAGSADPDGDTLRYAWLVTSPESGARSYTSANPRVSFTTPGVYTATLTATDASGASSTSSVDIIAGNSPPDVAVRATGINQTFFRPGAPIEYAVTVADREDRSTAADRVALSIDYVPANFDLALLLEADRQPVDATTRFAVAKAMMARTDCSGCHIRNTPSLGPTFVMLSTKYRPDPTTIGALAMKVRMGSSKVWGEAEMPPHPGLTTHEIRTIVEYMLSATDERMSVLPLDGRYTAALPADDNGRGHVVIRAAYTDNPVGRLPSQTTIATKVLRSPTLTPAAADVVRNITFGARGSGDGAETRNVAVTAMHDAHLGFRGIDLTGVSALTVNANTGGEMRAAGGVIEVRTGGPSGTLIGQGTVVVAPPRGRGAGPAAGAGGAGAPRGQGGGSGGPPPGPTITLTPTTGLHDVYLVFRNPQALPGQPLMTVTGVSVAVD
jgi:cytochrome c